MFRNKKVKVHFVGIGGIGMSGIAELLLNLGYGVSGSDLKESEITRRLASLGGKIVLGHRAENVGPDVDVVVTSSAVRRATNPEAVAARARGIPVIRRAEMLAELMRLKDAVAIAGSHGKTTTTSLIATVLEHAGLQPTAVVGGKLNAFGSNARLGKGEWIVVEADESDGSFLHLTPTIAVVTNVDPEHLDHYGTAEALQQAFVDFADRVPFYGLVVLCLDHPTVQHLIPRLSKRHVTYGISPQADWRADEVKLSAFSARFAVWHRAKRLGEVRCFGTLDDMNNWGGPKYMLGEVDTYKKFPDYDLYGDFNVNYVKLERVPGFDDWSAIHRVLRAGEFFVTTGEVLIPHWSVEGRGNKREVVADVEWTFPLGDFATAFNDADVLILGEIYAAGEEPIPNVSGEKLHAAVRACGHRDATFVPERAALAKALRARVRTGDLVLTLGAGDVTHVAEELLALLGGGPA